MEEKQLKTPQVLLLGNGLNRAYQGTGWGELIESIWTNKRIASQGVHDAPFPLQAVIATDDSLNKKLKEKPDAFYGGESIDEIRAPIEQLLDIRFDHILTTNYSYEIERVACPSVGRDGKYCKKLMTHTNARNTAESKYLLHTYNQIPYKGFVNKIWHIHGEIRKPQSVVLGHYYYGNLLGRYIAELDKRKYGQELRQKKHMPPIMNSWIDAFIMGDVYVLGFGYDFSELDMWWLLNRKKREKARHGKVIFYEPSFGQELKLSLLDTYSVQIQNMGFRTENPDYKAFYELAISDIQERVKQAREEKTYG